MRQEGKSTLKNNKLRLFLAFLSVLSLCSIEVKSMEVIHPNYVGGAWNDTMDPFTRIKLSDGKIIDWRDYSTRIITEECDVWYRVENGTHWHHRHKPKTQVVVTLKKLDAIKQEPMLCMAVFARRRVMLQYPPAGGVWHIPGGVSQLTAVLRQKGHEVKQRFGHIIGLEYLLKQHGGLVAQMAISAVRVAQGNAYGYYQARYSLERISTEINTPDKFRFERNNVIYQSQYHDGSISGVLKAIENRENHLWYQYFAEVEIPVAQVFDPRVYGISIGDERQLFPGLVLASMVKDTLPDCVVIVGGNFFGRMPDPTLYPEFIELFKHLDGVVYAEGFQPLEEIAETLDVSTTSGMIWRKGVEVVKNPRTKSPTDFYSLPTPALDGGATQWAPEMVPTLYTQSHCPLACDFCAIAVQSDTFAPGRLDTVQKLKPRSMTPRRIAEHMQSTGAHKFDIADELFSIQRQLELGRELRSVGYEAVWQCYLTVTDNLLNPQVAHDLYEAGCRAVQFGLETLSKDTLLKIHKQWNTPSSYDRILKNFRDAGIHTHVFIMIGLPSESLSEGLKWVSFLKKYGRNILTVKSARWRPARFAPEVEKNLLADQVELYPDTKPFQTNRSFRYRSTTHSNTKVDAMRDIVEQACRRHWAYNVTSTIPWWINRSRYTWEELEDMAKELPIEPDIPYLDDRIAQMRYLVRTELKREANFQTWEELVAFTETLL